MVQTISLIFGSPTSILEFQIVSYILMEYNHGILSKRLSDSKNYEDSEVLNALEEFVIAGETKYLICLYISSTSILRKTH